MVLSLPLEISFDPNQEPDRRTDKMQTLATLSLGNMLWKIIYRTNFFIYFFTSFNLFFSFFCYTMLCYYLCFINKSSSLIILNIHRKKPLNFHVSKNLKPNCIKNNLNSLLLFFSRRLLDPIFRFYFWSLCVSFLFSRNLSLHSPITHKKKYYVHWYNSHHLFTLLFLFMCSLLIY